MARFFRLAAFPLLASLAACSSSSTGDNPPGFGSYGGSGNGANGTGSNGTGAVDGTSGSTGNSGASSGTGASDNAGGSSSTDNTGGSGNATGGTSTTTGGAATTGGTLSSTGGAGGINACVETSAEAQAAPPILEFVVDNTQSMSDTAPSTGGQTKMACTRTALANAFPTMPAEYAVGMTYYHVNNVAGGCNDARQAVPIAPMTAAQLQALLNSINTQAQIQMTPSEDAWRFAANYVQTYTGLPDNYATSKRYVVVLTDGVPTLGQNCAGSAGCNQGVSAAQYQTYIDAVAAAYAGTGLQTFVIGIPGSENTNQVTCTNGTVEYLPQTKLSEVAVAGGTAPSGCSVTGPTWCHIDLTNQNINFVTELTRVIGAITSTVATCEYTVPTVSDPSLVIDLSKVEVRYYPSGGTDYRVLQHSEGCVATGGWQFTDATQTHIMLCSDACDTVKGDSASRVEVYFGCLQRQ
jgi:hypothetical protein